MGTGSARQEGTAMNRSSRTVAHQATGRCARDLVAVAVSAWPAPLCAGLPSAAARPDLADWWARRTRRHHRRAATRRRVRVVPPAAAVRTAIAAAVVLALALAAVLLVLSLDLAGLRFGLGATGA